MNFTNDSTLATLAGLDRAIRDALAAGYTDDHRNLVRIRAAMAADARVAADATATCTDCGGVATRLPVTYHTTGQMDFYCPACREILSVYPAAERMAA